MSAILGLNMEPDDANVSSRLFVYTCKRALVDNPILMIRFPCLFSGWCEHGGPSHCLHCLSGSR
jgi:hypothetical protein